MNTQIVQTPILAAEDNPNDLFFLQHRLRAGGILNPVRHVEDGAEAIELLDSLFAPGAEPAMRPWLLFLDLKMPRRDGFEVLAWINDRQLGDVLTTIVISTAGEPEDVARANELGAHRFLVKYPRPDELADAVNFALRRAIDHGIVAEPAGVRPA